MAFASSTPRSAFNAALAPYAGPVPPHEGMTVPVERATLEMIGLVVVQWIHICTLIDAEIERMSEEDGLPAELQSGAPRPDTSSKLAHLRKLAGHVYGSGREGGLQLYLENLDRLLSLKEQRDGVARGSYDSLHNEDPAALVVTVKGKAREYDRNKLWHIAEEIGQCASFFLHFPFWNSYSPDLASRQTA